MDSKPLVRLPSDLIDKCHQFGSDLASHYGSGGSPRSREVSTHGMQSNPEGLAASKIAECIFCVQFDIDPLKLPWACTADGGWDIVLFGQRVDVKSTWLRGKFLIWPVGKNHIFDSKQFDMLALVKLERDERIKGRAVGNGFAYGWVSKKEFRKKRLIADYGHPLDAGTRYVPDDYLSPVENGGRALAWLAISERKQFEFITGKWPG